MKVHQLFEEQTEWLLPKGWVMSFHRELPDNNKIYHITRLMDDTVVATAGSMNTNDNDVGKWYMYTPNPTPTEVRIAVPKRNQADMLKFKWWVTNQLVNLGYLAAKDLQNAK